MPDPGGLPRTSVVRITDRPDMTSAVYIGRKATQLTNKNKTSAENTFFHNLADNDSIIR